MSNGTVGENTPELQLTHADEPWLAQLSEEQISDTWLQTANELIVVGAATSKPGSTRLSEAASSTRTYFYEELLGCARPESPIHDAYNSLIDGRRTLPPTDRFIGAMRLFHQAGYDVAKVSQSYAKSWAMPSEKLQAKLDGVEAVLGSEDAHAVIGANPHVLAYANYPRKVSSIIGAAERLGWGRDNAVEMIKFKPNVPNGSATRLAVHAHYFARFGSIDYTPVQAGNLMLINPDNHLVALERGIPAYTHSLVRRATRDMTTSEIRDEATGILSCQTRSRTLGQGVVRAHQRLHELQNKTQTSAP